MTNEQYIDMLRYQDTFNRETNGKYWFLGKADNGKGIVWDLCYCMERAELLNWFNWKHWKDSIGCNSITQVKIELTDMWHFVMSKILEIGYINLIQRKLSTLDGYMSSEPKTNEEVMEWVNKIDMDSAEFKEEVEQLYTQLQIATNITHSVNEQKTQLEKQAEKANTKISEADFLSIVINGVLGNTNTLAHEKDASMQTYILQEFYLLIALSDLVYKFGVDDLYKFYIGKIALNKLRQDKGYKNNTYKKMWTIDGVEKEDNDVMAELLDKEDSTLLTPDNFYGKLEEVYTKLK